MESYTKEIFVYPSSCPERTVTYCVFKPLSPPRAIVQLSHGMCEYVERYEPFAEFLTSRGILFCGNDHLGHGRTGDKYNEFGFFSESSGDSYLTEDVHTLTTIMKGQYPDLPYLLMGHSMGSFITRDYLSKYAVEIDGCILSGTSGRNPLSAFGAGTAHRIGRIRGGKHRSNIVKQLAIGTYNKGYGTIGQENWICRDPKVVEKYRNDKYCNFEFTMMGYRDMCTLLHRVNLDSWYDSFPKEFPLLFISGTGDPVGRYGKGVNQVVRQLEERGHSNVVSLLYPEARHELCNELNKKDVYRDLYTWISQGFLSISLDEKEKEKDRVREEEERESKKEEEKVPATP